MAKNLIENIAIVGAGGNVGKFIAEELLKTGKHKSHRYQLVKIARCAYISSFTISQNDMLESVFRVTGTDLNDWKVTKAPVKEYYKSGLEEFQKGNMIEFAQLLYSRAFFPESSGNFGATMGLHNDVLGLPKEDLDEFTKIAVQRSEKGVE
ncbi:hypothetical protein V1515DRAFT_578893 [Lipomyces mesembrius]